MTNRLQKFTEVQDTLTLLGKVRISARELAQARAQLLRAEAIADLLYRAWIATRTMARRLGVAIVRRAAAFANAYAESAIRVSERTRDAYLSRATDTADLERRMRSWQMRGWVPLS